MCVCVYFSIMLKKVDFFQTPECATPDREFKRKTTEKTINKCIKASASLYLCFVSLDCTARRKEDTGNSIFQDLLKKTVCLLAYAKLF